LGTGRGSGEREGPGGFPRNWKGGRRCMDFIRRRLRNQAVMELGVIRGLREGAGNNKKGSGKKLQLLYSRWTLMLMFDLNGRVEGAGGKECGKKANTNNSKIAVLEDGVVGYSFRPEVLFKPAASDIGRPGRGGQVGTSFDSGLEVRFRPTLR